MSLYKLTVNAGKDSNGRLNAEKEVQVESAIKDSEGNKICDTFLKKSVGTASQGVVVDNADTKFIAEVTKNSNQSKLLLSDSLFKISTDAKNNNHELTFDSNGDLNFTGSIHNSTIFESNGTTVKNATTASTAVSSTNSSYASHIGTSTSHPSKGNTTTPVYVNTAGTVAVCAGEIGQRTVYDSAFNTNCAIASDDIILADIEDMNYTSNSIDNISCISLYGYPNNSSTSGTSYYFTGNVGMAGNAVLMGIPSSASDPQFLECHLEIVDNKLHLMITKLTDYAARTNTHFYIHAWLIKFSAYNKTKSL